jgi:hypothetical protein
MLSHIQTDTLKYETPLNSTEKKIKTTSHIHTMYPSQYMGNARKHIFYRGVCTLECLKKGRHKDSFLHILHVFPKSPKKEEGKL